jgi:orotate phosphoribosyltransferase
MIGPLDIHSDSRMIERTMTDNELVHRVRELAVLWGDFTLRSGRKSKYYIDKYRFSTDPQVLAELGRRFAVHITDEVTRIAGAELGGVPLAAITAVTANKPYVIVRNQKKDYGTSKLVEGVIEKGDRILLVEDILTTGGQVLEAAKSLQEAGAEIVKIVAVIDRLEGARANIEGAGFELASLLTTADLNLGGPH